MSRKKKRQLIILNAAIILSNILLFSKAFLGIALFTGSAFSISLAWTSIVTSVIVFASGNLRLLKREELRMPVQNIQSLDDCIVGLKDALDASDIFDDDIEQNIEQIKRLRRKHTTIKDTLLQKFTVSEMSYQKFDVVLQNVEDVIYMNIRSILNKISAFDIIEYENLHKKGFKSDELSQEKMEIYNEYIDFVKNATTANEKILLKLDKMLLEISRYNSLEDGDVQKLPVIIEMDELIKNANLYK